MEPAPPPRIEPQALDRNILVPGAGEDQDEDREGSRLGRSLAWGNQHRTAFRFCMRLPNPATNQAFAFFLLLARTSSSWKKATSWRNDDASSLTRENPVIPPESCVMLANRGRVTAESLARPHHAQDSMAFQIAWSPSRSARLSRVELLLLFLQTVLRLARERAVLEASSRQLESVEGPPQGVELMARELPDIGDA